MAQHPPDSHDDTREPEPSPPEVAAPVPSRRRGAFRLVLALLAVAVGLAIVFGVGYLTHWGLAPADDTASGKTSPAADGDTEQEETEEVRWTCSMHPQIDLPDPGLCPICGMELIPREKDAGGAETERQLEVSTAARKIMDIQTAPVERRFATAVTRMVGRVAYDETRERTITAWVGGRLDRLFVDYTGVPVRKGDHLVEIYSPELYAAQEELIQAIEATRELGSSEMDIMRETARATVEAAREKLRLLGLKPEQIRQIEKRGEPSEHITIYSPIAGIVVHKNAREGMYVETGSAIYKVVDLSQVWVMLDAYESDLQWLHYGQEVTFTSVAYPGETFRGTISFIDPVVNQRTRTVRVRVEAPNLDGKLKPDMFVKARVRSRLAAAGRVVDPRLGGKYICPMHPSVIQDEPGQCSICGMDLVTTESLGYAPTTAKAEEAPLVIPATAPLLTGERAVVYVQVPEAEHPTYEGREIVLGPRAGDYYLVREGLSEGERVVTRGNFKIDAALQIRAKPSMMSVPSEPPKTPIPLPPEDAHGAAPPPLPEAARTTLARLTRGYLAVAEALAEDDLEAAKEAVDDMRGVAAASKEMDRAMNPVLAKAAEAETLQTFRQAFDVLSNWLRRKVARHGAPLDQPLYLLKCPMAFDNRGAVWLQTDRTTRNPYFGSAMLKCGDVIETYEAATPHEAADHAKPAEETKETDRHAH